MPAASVKMVIIMACNTNGSHTVPRGRALNFLLILGLSYQGTGRCSKVNELRGLSTLAMFASNAHRRAIQK